MESWPADGSQAVPPNLRFIAFRFDLPQLPPGEIHLENMAAGVAVDVAPMQSTCAAIGWPSGACAVAQPMLSLEPNQSYKMFWQLPDINSAPETWSAVFHTQPSTDNTPPSWQPASCALDETEVEFGCILQWDVGFEARVFLSEAARVWLRCNDKRSSAVAHRGTAWLAITDLPSGSQMPLELTVADAADNAMRARLEITTVDDLPTLSISKVMANPRGPEPQQEFIEIHNFGGKPIELLGFQLSDDAAREGDVIQQALALGPQRRALLVASDFDAQAASDALIPPGLPLIHLDESLAYGGLSNAGEPLYLRDNHGRRLSGAPPMAMPKPGGCMVRTSPNPRSDRADHFSYEPRGECAPGSPMLANDD